MTEPYNNLYLDRYLELTNAQEIPHIYNVWCGVFTLSAALERRCYTEWLDFVWPNQWVCLVGEAASRKSTAMAEAQQLLERSNIWMGPEVTSMEKMINEFSSDITNLQCFWNPDTKKIEFHSSLCVIADELTNFTKVKESGYVQELCRLYACPHPFRVQTLRRGKEKAVRVCVNLLAGTTPDALHKHMPEEMLSGGFGSRMMFVFGEKPTVRKNKKLPLGWKRERQDWLVDYLRGVSCLRGGFTYGDDVFELYEQWRTRSEEVDPPPIYYVPTLTHYCGRRLTHFRKLLMAISAGRSADMRITQADFDCALRIIHETEDVMPRALSRLSPRTSEEMFTYLGVRIGIHSPTLKKPDAPGLRYEELIKVVAGYWNKQQLNEALGIMKDCKYVKTQTKDGAVRYIKGAEFPTDWVY